MQTAMVVGTATSTVKHPSMQGQKLLVVQSYMTDDRTPDGDPLLVIDAFGAGVGERVLITNDSKEIKSLLRSDNSPVRWCVMGIAE
jgi:ethanolamine utilization protein EutN